MATGYVADVDTVFLGIDLAWSPRHASGVAALVPVPERDALAVRACALVQGDDELLGFVQTHLAATMVIMVDAPLRVPNATGRRTCEALVAQRFGRAEAGAHPSNRARLEATCGGVRGERLAAALGAFGVREAGLDAAGRGRTIFECYPHPAHVVLFGLTRTLKYKKKRQPWDVARAALAEYLARMGSLAAPTIELPASLAEALAPGDSVGRAYKSREDRLDAIFCAYLAALAPRGRLEMLGSVEEGHIVVPRGG
jgi:predicted RNase H-like nuclease